MHNARNRTAPMRYTIAPVTLSRAVLADSRIATLVRPPSVPRRGRPPRSARGSARRHSMSLRRLKYEWAAAFGATRPRACLAVAGIGRNGTVAQAAVLASFLPLRFLKGSFHALSRSGHHVQTRNTQESAHATKEHSATDALTSQWCRKGPLDRGCAQTKSHSCSCLTARD